MDHYNRLSANAIEKICNRYHIVDNIQGTGKNGRVLKRDRINVLSSILNYNNHIEFVRCITVGNKQFWVQLHQQYFQFKNIQLTRNEWIIDDDVFIPIDCCDIGNITVANHNIGKHWFLMNILTVTNFMRELINIKKMIDVKRSELYIKSYMIKDVFLPDIWRYYIQFVLNDY